MHYQQTRLDLVFGLKLFLRKLSAFNYEIILPLKRHFLLSHPSFYLSWSRSISSESHLRLFLNVQILIQFTVVQGFHQSFRWQEWYHRDLIFPPETLTLPQRMLAFCFQIITHLAIVDYALSHVNLASMTAHPLRINPFSLIFSPYSFSMRTLNSSLYHLLVHQIMS